jgi:hypothetical protein
MNTWNSLLPESYHQRVYNNTDATVNRQIQQVENLKPAMVISVEAARVDNAILLDYLASEVALQEPEIETTDPNIPIDKIWRDDELHFGMPGVSEDYIDDGDESDDHDTIPTPSWRRRPAMELERFHLGTSDPNGYEGQDGDDGPRRNSRRSTWEPMISTGMRARMATMQMRMGMRRKNHCKSMMVQHRMWRTEGIVLESVKSRLYISDL